MSCEAENEKKRQKSHENNKNQNNSEEQNPQIKINKKERRATRKISNAQKKVVPLLKPPSKRRKFDKEGKTINQEKIQTGIIWDNKTIEEQYLDRKLHPRVKIDEPKTPYPDGDEEDVYQEGINKVNEIKPTQELLNNVVASLNKEKNDENNSNTKELKIKAYSNEYTKALQFYNDNKEKYEDLSGERKICLQNTLINKFHKEVRSLSKGKIHVNNS